MNVTSYTFQSPYPNQVQIGRPDPQTQQQSQQKEAVDTFAGAAGKPTQKEADAYLSSSMTGASVNVAGSTANNSVTPAAATSTGVCFISPIGVCFVALSFFFILKSRRMRRAGGVYRRPGPVPRERTDEVRCPSVSTPFTPSVP